MKKVWIVVAVFLLAACGSTEREPAEGSSATSDAPAASAAEKESGPLSALEVVALSEQAGVECPGDWQQSEGFDSGPVPIVGADETWRCGQWYNDPNRADDEWLTIATFGSDENMATILDTAEGQVFIGDQWVMIGDGVDALADVAEGSLR